jgi:hypothetical protein
MTLSGSITCPFCRYANPPGKLFCANCAGRLIVGPQPAATPQPPQNTPPPQGPGSAPWVWKSIEASRQTGISRTKTGLLLIIVGLILGPIPYVTYIGTISAIIGGIMVILGRNNFPGRHSNFVISSVVLYILGSVILFVDYFVFGLTLFQVAIRGGSQAVLTKSLIDAFNGLLVGIVASVVVISVAYVLFTYALQDPSGRLLLYIAFVVQLAFGILDAYLLSGQIAGAVSQSFQGGSYDPSPITSLQSQIQYQQLLWLIPAGLFAIAYYRVYSRISRGEIPPPITTHGLERVSHS